MTSKMHIVLIKIRRSTGRAHQSSKKFTISLLAMNFKNSVDWANIYTGTKILSLHHCTLGVDKIKNVVID